MVSTFEIFGLFFCILASAFFSASEAVLMSVGIDRAKQLIDQGGRKAKAMLFMAERSTELLTVILIGNNIANIVAASLMTSLTARYFESDVVSISAGITTIIILIFGEIMPKTLGRTQAEYFSVPVIRMLQVLYFVFYPVVVVTVWFISKVLGKNAQLRGRLVTIQDIEYLINKAERENTMDSKQIELISSALEFPSIRVKDIMVPRSQIKYLRKDMPFEQILTYAKSDEYTRYPVCTGDLEHTIGFLHIKDLAFVRDRLREQFDITKYVKPQFFVYEHMKINAVFDHMNRKKTHLSLVKNENGIVVGLVTLEDIIEEVLGDIIDEHDDHPPVTEDIAENSREGVVVPATISLRDLYGDYDVKIPPDDNYSTLAGFILDLLGNQFPRKGQIIVWEGHSFELIKVDDHEVKKVLIRKSDENQTHDFNHNDSGEGENSSSRPKILS
jgi:putative hemolysin